MEKIYALGRHHSNPPEINDLPFHTTQSERFSFRVPDLSGSYREIELIDHYNIGTHTLLIGNILNKKEIKEVTSVLYHVHYFEYLISNYEKA
jgi:hypothetical protein